ncbi:MAG: NAD-dependent succinate-semialdehyde dehydrogenase [Chitinophagales bacterium]|nr:NAD-dependent succinate-semialdehyde dehydrogenase [Chitinophagales bacterium]
MSFKSINPFTEELIFEAAPHSTEEVNSIARSAANIQKEWKNLGIKERLEPLSRLASVLKNDKNYLAATITTEMGKPLDQSINEIEKCAWLCEYYFENAASQLSKVDIETDAKESYVRYDPLGVVLAIMPWNFPFWQLFRAAVPAICAGNSVLLKHAANVPQSSISIEKVFTKAGFPEGLISNIFADHDQIESIIADDVVSAITLTGSEKAGSSIGSIAAKNIKKCVMELGGNDAFIMLPDADMEIAVEKAVKSRMQNNGQSCIAAKRFIAHADIYDEFLEMFTQKISELKIGDPMEKNIDIGPIARDDLSYQIKVQINHSELKGAKVHWQNENLPQKGFFVSPTVLTNVKKGTPAFDEEIFGPIASVIKAKNEDEAIMLANDSVYGLGASLWTADEDKATKLIPQINTGSVMVNTIVKSDPRMPFGGIKRSGYGRELSSYGIHEFVNIKSVQRY